AQPVDRIRIIQCKLVAVLMIPVLITLAPWQMRLIAPVSGFVAETSSETAHQSGVHDPLSSTTSAPSQIAVGDRPWASSIPPVGSQSAQDARVTRAEELSGVTAGFSPGLRPD